MLFKWGIKPSKLCRFCCKETESMDNLYCTHVACFWSQVQEGLKNCNIYLELTLQIALLRYLKSHSQSINNIITLLAKMFIFDLQSVETPHIGFKGFLSQNFLGHLKLISCIFTQPNMLFLFFFKQLAKMQTTLVKNSTLSQHNFLRSSYFTFV
jgi:hypothetical protein